MPKLRVGSNDTEKFAEWLGRKVKNHNPLAELSLSVSERERKSNIYNASGKGHVALVVGGRDTVICSAGGRVFEIKVKEISCEATSELELVAV